MQWLAVALIGVIIGTLGSFILPSGTAYKMPQSLAIGLGLIGALLGGCLFLVTKVPVFGDGSFLFFGVLVSLAFLIGGILAFNLTSAKRVPR